MDNRPIGLLDSGVGGLTVARQLFYQLPNEEVVYIGDTARMPYGPKPTEEILQYTREMVHFLLNKNVKMIVFACNTATAIALETIREEVDVPLIGVISAGANAAVKATKGKRLAIIGTQATVNSGSYPAAIAAQSDQFSVESLACPDFVTLVESGDFENEQAFALIQKNLAPLVGKVDTLILGCTHYPLLEPQIQKVMGDDVLLIDAGAEAVRDVAALLNYSKLNADVRDKLHHQFYTTGNAADFKAIADKWLNQDITAESVDIAQKQKVLIATKNRGKVREFQKAFSQIGYEVESLLDYPDLPDIEETGSSFEENARLKAETIAKLTSRTVIADDSGLCVDVLGGLPGIWSHRFAGPDPTDLENNVKLLHELESTEVTPERRTAHFHTTLVAAAPDKESLVVEADWPGRIAIEPKGEDGFGYDPLFLIGDSEKTAAELSVDEKNEISHRGLAFKKLINLFPDWNKN